MEIGLLTAIGPPPDTVETAVHGAPVIYDPAPAGAPQSQEPINGDVDPYPSSYRAAPEPYQAPAPAPLIYTVPAGGIVLDAGQITNAAATVNVRQIGVPAESRLGTMGMMLLYTGAGTVEIMPNGSPDSAGNGFLLPAAGVATMPFYLPIIRANVRLSGVVALSYLVIASPTSQG